MPRISGFSDTTADQRFGERLHDEKRVLFAHIHHENKSYIGYLKQDKFSDVVTTAVLSSGGYISAALLRAKVSSTDLATTDY